MRDSDRSSISKRMSLTGWLLGLQALLVVGFVILVPFQSMRTAVCEAQCDFSAASAAVVGGTVAVFSILVVTVAVLLIRRAQYARNWPIVLLGVTLTAVAMFVSNELFKAALPPV